MTNWYEEKQQRRLERFQELAEKNKEKGKELFNQAHKMADVIPFGQPILIGHHSERRDRNYRDRIENTYRKSFETNEKAAYYEDRVKSIEKNNSISSDDPEAVQRLKEKLDGVLKEIVYWKTIKKAEPRTYDSSPEDARWYMLDNRNAEKRRILKRIEEIQNLSQVETDQTINGIRIFTDENRVKIEFGYKPSEETRTKLKHGGFRWSPFNQTWQSFLKPHYILRAVEIVKEEKRD